MSGGADDAEPGAAGASAASAAPAAAGDVRILPIGATQFAVEFAIVAIATGVFTAVAVVMRANARKRGALRRLRGATRLDIACECSLLGAIDAPSARGTAADSPCARQRRPRSAKAPARPG